MKKLVSTYSANLRKHRMSVLCGLLMTTLVVMFQTLPALEDMHRRVERITFDARQKARPAVPVSPLITNVDIDDTSIQQIGRWPWDRRVWGAIVQVLQELGAKLIVFDVEFEETSPVTVDMSALQTRIQFKVEQYKHLFNPEASYSDITSTLSKALDEYKNERLDDPVRSAIIEKLVKNGLFPLAARTNEFLASEVELFFDELSELIGDEDRLFAEGLSCSDRVLLPFHLMQKKKYNTPAIEGKFHEIRELILANRKIDNKEIAEKTGLSVTEVNLDRDTLTMHFLLDNGVVRPLFKQIVQNGFQVRPNELREKINAYLREKAGEQLSPQKKNVVPVPFVFLTESNRLWINEIIKMKYAEEAPEYRTYYLDDHNTQYNIITFKEIMMEEVLSEEIQRHMSDSGEFSSIDWDQYWDEVVLPKYFPKLQKKLTSDKRIAQNLYYRLLSLHLIESKHTLPIPYDHEHFTLGFSIAPATYPLLKNATSTAYVTYIADGDGILRQVPLVYVGDGNLYPAVSMRAAMLALQVPPERMEVYPGSHILLRDAHFPGGVVSDLRIPVDDKCRLLINWAGRYGEYEGWKKTFIHIKCAQLYELFDRRYTLNESLLPLLMLHNKQINPNTPGNPYLRSDSIYEDPIIKDRWPELYALVYNQKIKQTDMMAWIERQPVSFFVDYSDAMILAVNNALSDPLRTTSSRSRAQKGFIYKNELLDVLEKIKIAVKEYNIRKYGDDKREGLEKFVKDKICIIGSAHTGSTDFKATPIFPSIPGVLLHSNAINMMLNPETFLFEAPKSTNVMIALGVGTLTAIVVSTMPAYLGFLYLALASVGFFFLSTWLMANQYVIDTASPIALMILGYIVISTYRYFTEGAEKRRIKDVFSKYVSPKYVEQLVANPDRVKLGGESKIMTAHFSDIAKFSSFSEKLTAEQLVHVLNIYLTEMSNIIEGYQGTVDKFEGDAVIAFYGAPLDIPNHAELAVAGALREREAVTAINERLAAERVMPEGMKIKARIGLNSGEMVVGNMGSQNKFNYTMMGDNVNLASRLEGANKFFGSLLMVGNNTYKLTRDQFVYRRFCNLVVVGRKAPEPVFEPFGRKGEVAQEVIDRIDLFHRALEQFEKAKWDEAEALFKECVQKYDDYVAKTFLETHLPAHKAMNLGPNWDGAIILTEKG